MRRYNQLEKSILGKKTCTINPKDTFEKLKGNFGKQ